MLLPAAYERHTGKIPDDRLIGYRRDTVAKILKIVHFFRRKMDDLDRLKVLLNSYLSLILVLLYSYMLKILKIVHFLCDFFLFCENGRYLANLCLCISRKCSNFALAYVKARYDSRLCRSMETRLTLRSPHSKQPAALFTPGTPNKMIQYENE